MNLHERLFVESSRSLIGTTGIAHGLVDDGAAELGTGMNLFERALGLAFSLDGHRAAAVADDVVALEGHELGLGVHLLEASAGEVGFEALGHVAHERRVHDGFGPDSGSGFDDGCGFNSGFCSGFDSLGLEFDSFNLNLNLSRLFLLGLKGLGGDGDLPERIGLGDDAGADGGRTSRSFP